MTEVESLHFSDLTLTAGNVLVLDENDQVVGAYATIQAAVNASHDGYTIQVGTGTYLANNATVDRIVYDFTATPSIIGNGVQQVATSGGDVSPGVVSARVVGNSFAAAANLTATTGGALSDGAGDTISWSEIAIATAAGVPATATNLAHPGTPNLSDAGSTTVSLTPVSKIINQTAQWTFKYKNTTIPPAGTYGATGAAPVEAVDGAVAARGQISDAITATPVSSA